MALSHVTYPSDGVTKEFTLTFALGYISEDHIKAWVEGEYASDGSKSYRSLTFLSRERVRLEGTVPAAGVNIEFSREVPKEKEIIEYSNGDALNEDNLDTAQKQSLMTAHEALDAASRARTDLTAELENTKAKIKEEIDGLAGQVVFVFVEKEPDDSDRNYYVHTQTTPDAVWVVQHNLDTYPGVAVYDQNGVFLAVEYTFSTRNQMRITFAQPERGVAYVH